MTTTTNQSTNAVDPVVTMSIPEAIYIVRQHAKRCEQKAEELYTSGQGDLAGENNGSGTCPQDLAPPGYEPRSLTLAKTVVRRQLSCGDVETIRKPAVEDLPWLQDQDDDRD